MDIAIVGGGIVGLALALGLHWRGVSARDYEAAPEPRDVVVPSWKALRLRADSQIVLFGYSDKACQEKLNLYKEDNL